MSKSKSKSPPTYSVPDMPPRPFLMEHDGTNLVAVGDIHCGSTWGLCPPNFALLDGPSVTLSPFQQTLWGLWNRWIEEEIDPLPDGYTVVFMGDATEGAHHRTTQIISPDLGDHFNCAIEVLGRIMKRAGKIYFILGTECHTHTMEAGLGRHFGAVRCPLTPAMAAWNRLDLAYDDGGDGSFIRFVHHMPTSAREWTSATGLGTNIADHQLVMAQAGASIPRVVVSGHRHKYGVYENGDSMSIAMPCWQGLTRHGHKVVPAAITKVGGVVFNFDRRKLLPDTSRWTRTIIL